MKVVRGTKHPRCGELRLSVKDLLQALLYNRPTGSGKTTLFKLLVHRLYVRCATR